MSGLLVCVTFKPGVAAATGICWAALATGVCSLPLAGHDVGCWPHLSVCCEPAEPWLASSPKGDFGNALLRPRAGGPAWRGTTNPQP